MRMKSLFFGGLMIFLMAAAPARAYSPLCSCLENADGTVLCQGGLSEGSTAKATIRVMEKSGKIITEGKTDKNNPFVFTKPAGTDYKVICTAGEGHALEIDGKEIKGSQPAHTQKINDKSASRPDTPGTTLDTITVRAKEEPKNVDHHEISTEVLHRSQATEMKDVFAAEPSVSVGGGGARNAQRIYLRGIEGSNLNITLDGARQGRGLSQHRGGIPAIDPDLLKRVEIQAGPGADLGPGALGGSIRFETVDAQDLLDSGKLYGAKIAAGYSSAAQAIRGGTSLYGLLPLGIGVLGHISAEDRQNHRIGGGGETPDSSWVSRTAGKDRDYFLKLSMLERASHSLRLSAEQNTNSGHYQSGSTGSDMGYAVLGSTPVYQTVTRTSYIADYRYRPGNPLINGKLNAYYNDNILETRDSSAASNTRDAGGSLRNTFNFDLGITRHALVVGTDYLFEKLISDLANGSSVNNESSNFGVFLQERMSIGSLTLIVGGRADYYDAGYLHTSFTGTEISPNVGAEFEFEKGFVAFANYGEAVRATGIIPVGWMTSISPSVVFNDGTPLEPETSKQVSGGLRFKTTDVFHANDQISLESTVFETRMKNIIEIPSGGGGSQGTPVTKIWNNPNTVISRGCELRGSWALDRFQTTLAYSHVRIEENDQPTSIVRRKDAPTGDRLAWDNRWQALNSVVLGYTLTAVMRLKDVPVGQAERPGYVLHDIQAEWLPHFLPGTSIALAVRNLFDHRYYEQTSIASGTDNIIYEPGTDIRLTLSYRF